MHDRVIVGDGGKQVGEHHIAVGGTNHRLENGKRRRGVADELPLGLDEGAIMRVEPAPIDDDGAILEGAFAISSVGGEKDHLANNRFSNTRLRGSASPRFGDGGALGSAPDTGNLTDIKISLYPQI